MAELDLTQMRIDVDDLLSGDKEAGLASNAVKLASTTSFRTNLESSTPASFDGTELSTEPGVKGILPVEHGGTGKGTMSELAYALANESNMTSALADKLKENSSLFNAIAAALGSNQSFIQNMTSKVQDELNFNKIYPVGCYYWSAVDTDPATLFGIGTWERVSDRFVLAAGVTYEAGTTGGEATHKLTIAELPLHDHGYNNTGLTNNGGADPNGVNWYYVATGNSYNSTGRTGGDQPHNNMPPYEVAYCWKRTA